MQIEHSFETARLRVVDWHSWPRNAEFGLPAIVQALLVPAVTAPLPEAWRGAYSKSRAEAWIQDRDAEGSTCLATLRESSECVGLLFLHGSEPADSGPWELRIGYLIDQAHWGRGYATELIRGVASWAQTAGYGLLIAGVAVDNTASSRVLEKCGFLRTEDGSDREHFYAKQL